MKDAIQSVVHGLLATLSPKMHSKNPNQGNSGTLGTVDGATEGDCIDLVENTSLQFQPLISLPRDYLARLLFWYVHIFPMFTYICKHHLLTYFMLISVLKVPAYAHQGSMCSLDTL